MGTRGAQCGRKGVPIPPGCHKQLIAQGPPASGHMLMEMRKCVSLKVSRQENPQLNNFALKIKTLQADKILNSQLFPPLSET